MNSIFQSVKKQIIEASKQYKVKPYKVTSAQFWSGKSVVSEWEVRKSGGFLNIKDSLFPTPAAEVSQVQPKAKKKKEFKAEKKVLNTFEVHELDVQEAFEELGLKKNDILRMVVQPDTHCPEHDPKAIDVFCQFLEDYKPHALVNLGDFLENRSVAHWDSKTPKAKRLAPEIKVAREILEKIDKAAGPQCVIKRFLIGNHEDWINQYFTARIPEVADGLDELEVKLPNIDTLLRLKETGYRVIPLNEIFKFGHAHFIHGYYTGNAHAKKHLDVFGVNLYYGHLHDMQSYSGVSVNGIHEAASLGCLRTLNAEFLLGKPNNWAHSLTIMEFRSDGTFTRYSPVIVDGKFSYNGRLYSAE